MSRNDNVTNLLIGTLFLAGILFISYSLFSVVPIIFAILIILYFTNLNKQLIITIAAFLIGFFLHKYFSLMIMHIENSELRISLNRFSLLFVIGSLVVVSRVYKQPFRYNHKPVWNNTISFPFIWSGFHSLKISTFLIVAISLNSLVFLPFILKQDGSFLQKVVMLAILFSVINAILEEILWRGYLLSHLQESVNDYYALLFSSIGFGLQHISLGIPLVPSILFSFGGIFFAGIVIRSKSISPSIIWHILLNLGMVFSGFIV
jgi:membrane protease YdiL (CAAX protease family)